MTKGYFSVIPVPSQASYHTAWYSVLDPVVEAARQLHPAKVWEDMSPKLYTTFWTLSLYDLYVPTARYEEEVRKAREAIKELEDKIDMVTNNVCDWVAHVHTALKCVSEIPFSNFPPFFSALFSAVQ